MTRSKLFVRSHRDPIELEYDEAKAVDALLRDVSKPNNTPFSIEGVWSGTKGEMKFVIFGEKEYEQKNINALDEEEGKRFEAMLLPYRKQSQEELGNEFYSKDFWLQSKGFIRLDVWENGKGFSTVVNGDTIPQYEETLEFLARYDMWQAKKYYAKKMEEKRLQEMADKSGVSPEKPADNNKKK